MLYTQLSPHLCCNGSQPLGNIPSGSLASTHRLRLFPNPLATFPSGEAVRPPPTDYNFSLTAGNHLLPLCPPTIPVTIFLSLVARLLPLLASRHDSVVVASFASLHFTIPNQIKQEETCPSPDLPHRHRPKRQNLLPKNKNKSANEKFHHIHCRSDYPRTAELTIISKRFKGIHLSVIRMQYLEREREREREIEAVWSIYRFREMEASIDDW
ncbi:hypothetical protein TIFTF001_027293 [Ficus carica]|uniref:Uncharacterized protein n=1 Tax=Ficus carica TaxID=3494 RepID=A0AA88DN43_FICCA|nr:hypothetical protein TIFTF001_027293 [Ficus carica]